MSSPNRKRYRVRKTSTSSSSSSESSKKKNGEQRSQSQTSRSSHKPHVERHSRPSDAHRSRSSSRRRSRSSSQHRSHSSSRHHTRMPRETHVRDDIPVRPIISDKPQYLDARIFVGHLPSDRISNDEFQQHFSRYGKILDCVVHSKGYGFVQFLNENDALKAVTMEKDALFKGNVIDVKMAAEGRRGGSAAVRDRRSPPPFDRGPSAGYPPPPSAAGRERSPVRDPYVDRYRDPYREGRFPPRDPLAPRLPRDPLVPARERRDDPYFDDPYRRPLAADPFYDRYRDPYRRDPYADPYPRDPYVAPYREPAVQPPLPQLKMECMIVLMNTALREYGISIEVRLKQFGVITDIVVIPEDRTLQQQIEDISRRGGIFAIIVNSQNEVHRSLTLNILHGTPQEHRNMPFEDALSLVSTSFKKYLQGLRDKETPVPVVEKESVATAKAFVPPPKDVSYLLNLLADNRQLTVEELDKVIFYLRERRDKILEAEGRPKVPIDGVSAFGDVRADDSLIQQQELQSKILSMLNQNGTGSVPAASVRPSTMSVQSPQAVAGLVQPSSAASTSQSNAALINFDNPSVQKALDNLIQSGPNLLRNIGGSTQGQQTASTNSQSMVPPRSLGAGLVPAYNQMYSAPPTRPSLLPQPGKRSRY